MDHSITSRTHSRRVVHSATPFRLCKRGFKSTTLKGTMTMLKAYDQGYSDGLRGRAPRALSFKDAASRAIYAVAYGLGFDARGGRA